MATDKLAKCLDSHAVRHPFYLPLTNMTWNWQNCLKTSESIFMIHLLILWLVREAFSTTFCSEARHRTALSKTIFVFTLSVSSPWGLLCSRDTKVPSQSSSTTEKVCFLFVAIFKNSSFHDEFFRTAQVTFCLPAREKTRNLACGMRTTERD